MPSPLPSVFPPSAPSAPGPVAAVDGHPDTLASLGPHGSDRRTPGAGPASGAPARNLRDRPRVFPQQMSGSPAGHGGDGRASSHHVIPSRLGYHESRDRATRAREVGPAVNRPETADRPTTSLVASIGSRHGSLPSSNHRSTPRRDRRRRRSVHRPPRPRATRSGPASHASAPPPAGLDVQRHGRRGVPVLPARRRVLRAAWPFEHGWLTPPRQLTIATAFGLGLVTGGTWFSGRDRLYAAYLPAVGVGVLYLTVYAGHLLYGLLPTTVAFVGCGRDQPPRHRARASVRDQRLHGAGRGRCLPHADPHPGRVTPI